MFVNLGSPKEPSDVVDLLLQCHERIRSFVGIARRVAQAENPAPEDIRKAAAAVRRYFTEALPLHVNDEELSILPRLRGRDADVDAALEDMRREHSAHEPLLKSLVACCRELESAPERLDGVRESLLRAASALETDFDRHLRQEEERVFPVIRKLLSEEDRDAMLYELRSRRDPNSPR